MHSTNPTKPLQDFRIPSHLRPKRGHLLPQCSDLSWSGGIRPCAEPPAAPGGGTCCRRGGVTHQLLPELQGESSLAAHIAVCVEPVGT